jgi:Cdc25 family phosphatase
MSGATYYQYIDPRELADLIHHETVAIVDVRDEDFDEDGFSSSETRHHLTSVGYIPNAMNIPSEKWDDDEMVDQLISSHEGKQKIVFHCKMSQVRGPSCATRSVFCEDQALKFLDEQIS